MILSLLSLSPLLKDNPNRDIILYVISSLIYVVIHWISFSSIGDKITYIQKYKHFLYAIVACDLLYVNFVGQKKEQKHNNKLGQQLMCNDGVCMRYPKDGMKQHIDSQSKKEMKINEKNIQNGQNIQNAQNEVKENIQQQPVIINETVQHENTQQINYDNIPKQYNTQENMQNTDNHIEPSVTSNISIPVYAPQQNQKTDVMSNTSINLPTYTSGKDMKQS